MHFRPDSVLGVAGLVNAARAGNVVISSAVGNGVGDDKLVYTYVPTIIEYYLGEKPLLANVDTLRCWLDEEREEVLDRIHELVIKPVGDPAATESCSAPTHPRRSWRRSVARSRPTPRLDRPAGGAAVHRPDEGGRLPGAPARRPCAVRRERRRRRCGCCRAG